jgi:hypothetical protein
MGELKRRYYRFVYKNANKGIPNLMQSVVLAMATLFVADLLFSMMGRPGLMDLFIFDRNRILSGEVWRVLSFIILPPNYSPIFIIFALYLYWMMGKFLESFWGILKFNLFYFSGVLFTLIGGLILGATTNTYLNMSIFFAFALINPNFELRLFFFLPVKIKYLAMINAAFYVLMIFLSPWAEKVAIFVSLFNVLLFFGGTMFRGIKSFIQRKIKHLKWKNKIRDINWK